MNAPWSCSGSQPTVGFQEMKEQFAWPSLGANSCNPCPSPLTRKPKFCSETKMPMEKGHWRLQPLLDPSNRLARLETKVRLQTEQCPPHPLGLFNLAATDISYGCRMSQPPTSCGEWQKTCAAPPNTWQHVESKHGWSTAEEEEETQTFQTNSYCHTYDGHHAPLPLYTTISSLDVCWWLQG